jgi:hypothetical protein
MFIKYSDMRCCTPDHEVFFGQTGSAVIFAFEGGVVGFTSALLRSPQYAVKYVINRSVYKIL